MKIDITLKWNRNRNYFTYKNKIKWSIAQCLGYQPNKDKLKFKCIDFKFIKTWIKSK